MPQARTLFSFHGAFFQVQYTVIDPKAQRRYRTFDTHPWIIRSIDSGQRMMLGQRMVKNFCSLPVCLWSKCTKNTEQDTFEEDVMITNCMRLG